MAAAGAGPFSAFGTFLGAMVNRDGESMREVLAEPSTRAIVEIEAEA
jgi:hypothetical protein